MTGRTLGCLFDGIHGFGLGAATRGYRAAWTVENGDYPRQVLALRVPAADHLADVREVTGPPKVTGLTGGFPCQDLSHAGLGAGMRGSRSGLWSEFARIIADVDPEFVLIENVSALLSRGMELVVENLVELGYGVEWDCLPAAAFGAPHLRDRVWIMAHRLGAPCVFGDAAGLFPVAPGEVGGEWLRWPRAGWVDGDPLAVMPLTPLAPRAAFLGGGNIPTPLANAANRTGRGALTARQWSRPGLEQWVELAGGPLDRRKAGHDNLPTRVARDLWPTATASDSLGSRRSTARADEWTSNPGTTLLDAVSEAEGIRWPTPAASDGSRGPGYARNGRELDGGRAASGGDDLTTTVARTGEGNALNPAWVEWLMGFPLGWTDLRVANEDLVGALWEHGEPAGIPRTTTDVTRRAVRLKALGNALVPRAPAWILARYDLATGRTPR